ncbi:hypothetical protein FGIG_04731 [Fasciola gigantica]|uniref:Uncharacterized protein n=1 Tax=Fasciola gigantica TaxID=46835 RepID=A0A504YIJ1_FASGI|nr:hypothetical protein FGIG_04731 [Fasciola gigantica]
MNRLTSSTYTNFDELNHNSVAGKVISAKSIRQGDLVGSKEYRLDDLELKNGGRKVKNLQLKRHQLETKKRPLKEGFNEQSKYSYKPIDPSDFYLYGHYTQVS